MSRPTPQPSLFRGRVVIASCLLSLIAMIGTIVVDSAFAIEAHNESISDLASAISFPVEIEPKSIAIGDFNSDGKVDLAVANRSSGTVSILLGDGSGNFGAATNFPAGSEPFSLAVGDFNNDGKNDLVVTNDNVDTVSLLLGDGTGHFSTPSSFHVGETPLSVAVGDFNGDGNSDLAVANAGFNNGGVSVLLGTGTGSFNTAVNFIAGSRPRAVAIGDFNKDGKSDLAVANVGAGYNKISILLGDGNGNFGPAQNFPVGTSPIAITVGDFNKDGNSDLAVANTDSNNISVLIGDGKGGFGTPANFPAGTFPLSIVAGDFNADGKTDLGVGFNSQTNTIAILLGDDNGSFGTPANFTIGTGPSVLAVGDFNGDGKSDLAVANATSNDVSVLLNPPPNTSINNVMVTEGDNGISTANFTVTLSRVSDKPVRLNYVVTSGTATAGSDFDGSIGTGLLTIPAGSLTANIAISVNGDTTFEPDETFFVNLTNPVNTFIINGQGQGTILNDDPLPSISINDVSITEGDSGVKGANFTVRLSNASYQPITVNYATADGTATAGSDYAAKSGTLTYNPGETTKTLTIAVNSDTLTEPDETFFVNLGNAQNATISRSQGIGTIINDDPIYSVTGQVKDSANNPVSGVLITFDMNSRGTLSTKTTQTDANGNYSSGDLGGQNNVKVTPSKNGYTFNPSALAFVSTQGLSGSNIANFTATLLPTIQLNAASYSFAESVGQAQITVNRTGDTSGTSTVSYATSDTAGLAPCDPTKPGAVAGVASSRCDYATTIGTLQFAVGETSKTIFLPIVDDAYPEGNESFTLTLSKAQGATLGTNASATITIQDNDSAASANPIDNIAFFVNQHYIDFLERVPDAQYQVWQNILNNCPPSGKDANGNFCDRIEVSADFFRSEEFQTRGYFIYRFYKVLPTISDPNNPQNGHIPHYSEFAPDLARVSGVLSAQQLEDNKVAFITDFMNRTEFQQTYGTITDPTTYVNTLLQTVGLSNLDPTTKQSWITGLTNGSLTKATVLRALIERNEMSTKFFNEAFVIMQYFGYLRRDADASYASWINTMNSTGGDYRTMVNGFLNSAEYRQRFGP